MQYSVDQKMALQACSPRLRGSAGRRGSRRDANHRVEFVMCSVLVAVFKTEQIDIDASSSLVFLWTSRPGCPPRAAS